MYTTIIWWSEGFFVIPEQIKSLKKKNSPKKYAHNSIIFTNLRIFFFPWYDLQNCYFSKLINTFKLHVMPEFEHFSAFLESIWP